MSIVTTSSRKRPGRSTALPVAIAVVALLAAAAWFLLRPSAPVAPVPPPPPGEGPASSGPRDVGTPQQQPAAPADGTAAPRRPSTPATEAQGAGSRPSTPPAPQPSDPPTTGAASAGAAKSAPTPPPQVRRVFDNEVENQLEMLSRPGAGGGLQAPRVNMSHEETVEYLRRPVEIYEDDDAETVAAKERTAEMKTAALRYVEEGGTLNQFLRDYAAAATEEQETLRDVREEMKRILYAEGPEAAQAYLDEANRQLRGQNLPEVRLGKGLLRGYEKRMAAEREKALQ